MIVSEGNKLPALSLEVKALNDSSMKWYSVTLGASCFFLRMRRNQEQVFKSEEKLLLSLAIEWMESENRSIDILETKQTARRTKVAVKLLISPQMFHNTS